MKLNDFFQGVFCITLELGDHPDHPERLLAAVNEFAKHGIAVEFIQGVDGRKLDISEPMSSDGDSVVRKADMGCTLSHRKVVELAMARQLKNYCVFEDDVILAADFQERFNAYISQLHPYPYKLLYLGGDNQAASDTLIGGYSPNIKSTGRTLTTHAVGVDSSAFKELYNELCRHEKVDLNYSELHKRPGCYTMSPVIAGQRGGWSYILGKQVQNEHQFFKV